MTDNRLTPEEQAVLETARKWFNYRDPVNLARHSKAIRDFIRSQNEDTNGKSLAG